MKAFRVAFVLGSLILLVRSASAQVFLPDDPLWVDPDRLDMPAPAPSAYGGYFDAAARNLGLAGEHGGPALNVNTLGEVPNSSWYTNRHYHERLGLDALRAGPGRPPSQEAPWRVIGGGDETGRVVLDVRDGRGDRFTLKFDPVGFPELATGAETIAARLLYAAGYNVPDVHLVRFTRAQVLPPRGEGLAPPEGERLLGPARLRDLMSSVQRDPSGLYRAVAVRHPEGQPLSPFRYHGTRPDDANDLFPHEARRELRGLRLFAAWLGYDEVAGDNTLDVLVEEEGRSFVRHYLFDVGASLGAGQAGPKARWEGYEHLVDLQAILLRSATLGFVGAGWVGIDYPDVPAAGRFEAEHFRPEAWKPRLPNAAFERCDGADAFWAARQVRHFTDEEIAAAVAAADYADPRTSRYLADVLVARRDRIAQTYLPFAGGLDRFRVRAGRLHFDDLLARHRLDTLALTPVRRAVRWYAFSNRTGSLGRLLHEGSIGGSPLRLPEAEDAFLAAEVHTPGRGLTRAYLRREGADYEVVGLERLDAEAVAEREAWLRREERRWGGTSTPWSP